MKLNINLNKISPYSEKDINTYINIKYREAKIINQDKIKNKDTLFMLKDENDIKISHVINYIN